MTSRPPPPKIEKSAKSSSAERSAKYYENQKLIVAQRRLYKRISEGKQPFPATLSKLGLKLEGDKITGWDESITSPKHFTFEKAKPVENIVVPQVVKPTVPEGILTADKVVSFVQQHKKDVKTTTAAKYTQFTSALLNSGLIKNKYTDDIVEPLKTKMDQFLKSLHDKYMTRSEKHPNGQISGYRAVLQHSFVCVFTYPELSVLIGKDSRDKLSNAFELSKNSEASATEKRRDTTQVYNWDSIIEGVKKAAGKGSLSYLFLRVYDEAPIRTEYWRGKGIPILEEVGKVDENYLHRDGDSFTLHLGNWKTDGTKGTDPTVPKAKYPNGIDFKFSKDVNALITTSLKVKKRKIFFPLNMPDQLGYDIQYAGFKGFPYGESDKPNGAEIINGLRHTVATFYNRKSYQGNHPRGTELARLMLHSEGTSKVAYQNVSLDPLHPMSGDELAEFREKLDDIYK